MVLQGGLPIEVAGVGSVSTAGILWRTQGVLHLTVVVKATFQLVDGEPMQRVDAARVVPDDAYREGEEASLNEPSDRVPYLGQCDVLFEGCAYPTEKGATAITTHLTVRRGEQALLDKELYVYGDRADWSGEPQPLVAVPVVYERAYGGRQFSSNPVGVGIDGGVPNIIDARSPEIPGGYGPIAPSWDPRATRLAQTDSLLDGDIIEVPSDFDWSFFQAAPDDQRTPHLQGDEWIGIEGLTRGQVRLRSQLPGVAGSARVWMRGAPADDPGCSVAMVCDRLALQGDSLNCTVTWRGSFPIESRDVLQSLRVAATVAPSSQQPQWSSVRKDEDPPSRPVVLIDGRRFGFADDRGDGSAAATTRPGGLPEPRRRSTKAASSTLEITDDMLAAAAAEQTSAVPFADATPMSSQQRRELAKAAGDTRAEQSAGETGVLDIDALRAEYGGELPWEAPRTGADPSPFGEEPTEPLARAGSPSESVVDDAPFAIAPAGGSGQALRPAPMPGAPWEAIPAPLVAAPTNEGTADAATIQQALAGIAPSGTPPWLAQQPAAPSPAAPPPPARPPAAPSPAVPTAAAPHPEARPPAAAPVDPEPLAPSPTAVPAAGRDAFPPKRTSDTVPQLNATALSLATVGWQLAPPRYKLAVIVKATCDIGPDGRIELRDIADDPSGDSYEGDDPINGLRSASDLSIVKAKADLTVVGHAHAPGGSAKRMEVGFSFGGAGRSEALERRMAVFGDRAWGGSDEPQDFSRIALAWAHSFGGQGFDANPCGRGRAPTKTGAEPEITQDARDRAELRPNLEDPAALMLERSATTAPICFAPISPSWSARAAKLGTHDTAWAEQLAPYSAADFDPDFFQSAPPEQQIAYPKGNEPFSIWGMHPDGTVEGELPGVRPRCFVQMSEEAGASFEELPLNLDTVAVDMDAMVLQLVWRGALDVADDEAREVARLFLQTEQLDAAAMSIEEARRRYLSAELAAKATLDGARLPSAPVGADAGAISAGGGERDPLGALPLPLPENERVTRDRVSAQLASGAPLNELNMMDADLSGMDLSGQDLAGVVLSRADLSRCTLSEATLDGAQLSGADLSDASFAGAKLSMCDLQSAKIDRANFTGAELNYANFSKVTGEDTVFERARGTLMSFSDAELKRPRFDYATLTVADFTRATLEEASFIHAELPQLRLYETRAVGGRFDDAKLPDASAASAVLTGSSMRRIEGKGSQWQSAELEKCDFTAAKLEESGFVKASCDGAIFSGADLSRARFRKTKLRKVMMHGANLMAAAFEKADLSNANLSSANLYGTVGWRAITKGVILEGAIVDESQVFGDAKPSRRQRA